jgi:O-antigen/teichoic acid export membrane protein
MSFARQGTWMFLCTTIAGVFMFGVHAFSPFLGAASYSLFLALLGLINFSMILAPGLQTVFAYETAGVKDGSDQRGLAGNAVGVLSVLTLAWVLCVIILLVAQTWVLEKLKMTDGRALWVTLGVILPHLWLPVLMGVLQGKQAFGCLGWAVLCNGVGRFLAVGMILFLIGNSVSWVMLGPLIGVLGAVSLVVISCRDLLRAGLDRIAWRQWILRAIPLALGPGVFQFMLTADMIAARVRFSEVESGFYGASSMIGRGLVMFVGPIAGVMFPKLVSGAYANRGAKLVRDTALATILVVAFATCAGWLGCAFVPSMLELAAEAAWLPEGGRAGLEAKHSQLLLIAGLVPIFLVAMGPLAVANVYISHLVANERFRHIGVLVVLTIVYGIGLTTIQFSVRSLILWVGLGNVGILVGAFVFSRKLQSLSSDR